MPSAREINRRIKSVTNTQQITKAMIKRKSKRGRVFYGCSEYPNCDFVLWNQPVDKKCPVCGSIMIVKHYKTGPDKIFCSNAACENYKKGETVNEE